MEKRVGTHTEKVR